MFGSTSTPQTIGEHQARRLATAIEMTTQDNLIPIDITPRVTGGDVTRFRLSPAFPDTTSKAGTDVPQIAHGIAQELTAWSNRLNLAAEAIRERYPLPASPAV